MSEAVALTEQQKQVQLEVRRNKEIEALIGAVLLSKPELKESLSVQAVWQFLQLPDSSYGWVPPNDDKQAVMPFAAKALCILTTLRLGLIPGTSMVNWLGNNVYINTAGQRHIANTSPEFKWCGPLKARPLTEAEEKMLDIGPGDRALAVERDLELRGVKMSATGYGILDADDLRKTDRGYSKPGRNGKKDIYQTLITRAERDIFKHYLPLEVISEPDDFERAKNVTPQKHEPEKLVEMHREQAIDANMRAEAERIEATKRLFEQGCQRVIEAGGNPAQILGMSLEQVNTMRAEQIEGAWAMLEDFVAAKFAADQAEAKAKPAEPEPVKAARTDQGAVQSPKPKAYAMLEKVLKDDAEIPAEMRTILSQLGQCQLKDEDHLMLPQMIRIAKNGKTNALMDFAIERGVPL